MSFPEWSPIDPFVIDNHFADQLMWPQQRVILQPVQFLYQDVYSSEWTANRSYQNLDNQIYSNFNLFPIGIHTTNTEAHCSSSLYQLEQDNSIESNLQVNCRDANLSKESGESEEQFETNISHQNMEVPTASENENNSEVMETLTPEQERSEKMNPMLQCLKCPRKFPYQSALRRHMKAHKQDTKCTLCGKILSCLATLAQHMRMHKNERPFSCEECSKTFGSSYYLKIHMRLHSNETKYKCGQCHKSFITSYILKIHTRTHTNENPHKCNECPKSFKVFQALKIHTRTHTGERPYKCKDCPKSFKTSSALKVHTLTHTGERAFQCYECNNLFTCAGSLKKHKGRFHSKKVGKNNGR